MKHLLTTTVLATTTALAQATPLYHPPGSNLTYGEVSNGQTIMSDISNPAAGAAALKKNGDQYRFGILSSVGMGMEFGQVDNLYDRIDAEAESFLSLQGLGAINTVFSAVNEINSRVNSLNTVLADVEQRGFAKAFASLHLPTMPLVIANQSIGGSLVLDINGSLAARVTALHEPVDFNTDDALRGIDNSNDDLNLTFDALGNPTGFTVDNDSTVLVKATKVTELALGYSRPVLVSGDATLYGGLRARYYKVSTSRLGVRLGELPDNTRALFEDARNQDFTSDTGFGLDVGALWISKHYRLGATFTNLNKPDFDVASVDLTGYDPNSVVYRKLLTDNRYTMERQLRLEAALFTASQNWIFSGGLDANAVADAFGDEYQWATLSAAYATDSWIIPGIRAGYRTNLAGTEIDYLTVGGTLFKVFNLDAAWSTDTVTIDDTTVPRGAMVNLGLEVTF
jgi:hypothetical protein